MNQSGQPNLSENLSALVDGESTDWELKRLLSELDKEGDEGQSNDSSLTENSQSLRDQWHLSQVTSAILSKADQSGVDLSSRISAAIEAESAPTQKHRFFKPFSQVAVAASVAVLALVGIQQIPLYTEVETLPAETSVATEASTNYQPVVIPEGFELPPLEAQTVSSTLPIQGAEVSDPVDVQGFDPNFDTAELDQHIQEAISTHVENTSDSLNSVLPLARQIRVED